MVSRRFPYAYNLKYVSCTICTLITSGNVIESYFQWPEAEVLTTETTYVRKDVNILCQYDPSAVTGSRLTLIGCNPLADQSIRPLSRMQAKKETVRPRDKRKVKPINSTASHGLRIRMSVIRVSPETETVLAKRYKFHDRRINNLEAIDFLETAQRSFRNSDGAF